MSDARPPRYLPEQATDFLRHHFRDPSLIAIVLGSGEWSEAFGFRREGRDYVIRFGPYGEDFEHDMQAYAYAQENLPIPRVTEAGQAMGGFYAISERIHGQLIDELPAVELVQTIPSLFRTMDVIRATDISHTVGFGPQDANGQGRYGSWTEYLLAVNRQDPASRVQGWRGILEESAVTSAPFDKAYDKLAGVADALGNERYLAHNDMLNRNVFVDHGGICGVIDWGNALYGDFLYDLAMFIFWSPWFESMNGIDFYEQAKRHYDEIGLVIPNFETRLQACLIHMGLSGQTYHAFTKRYDMLERTAKRTLAVAGLE